MSAHRAATADEKIRRLLGEAVGRLPRPLFPGAVALVARRGVPGPPIVVGDAVRYASADGTELAHADRVAMRPDTLFDAASLTKLFTASTAMSLVEDGLLALDEPIATWLPTFGGGPRRQVTLRHLLAHTSGLPALLRLWEDQPDEGARHSAVLDTELANPPGQVFVYSDVGYMVAGFACEVAGGRPLPELVRTRVCEPLRLADTMFTPPQADLARIAATEDESPLRRGMIRGVVHDENSWSLGGTAGHAGIFTTAADLARLGIAISRGGALDGARILGEASVAAMLTDQLPGTAAPGFRQGLGFRLADPSFMGSLAADGAVGHTGFTGTSLVIDRSRDLVVVLLTNRVHPDRAWSDIAPVRRAVAEAAAAKAAVAEAAAAGPDAGRVPQ